MRAHQETKLIGLYAVARAHNYSQSAVYKLQDGRYGYTIPLDSACVFGTKRSRLELFMG